MVAEIRVCVDCGMENPEIAGFCMRCGEALVASRPPEQRVVVTGLGAITPLGLFINEFWDGLVEGRSGISRITHFDPSAYPTQIAGLINNFDARDFMDRKEARRLARFSQFAVAAARMALEDANLPVNGLRREDAGVLLGCGIGGLEVTHKAVHTMIKKGGMRLSPFYVVMLPPNMASFHVAKVFGFVGYNNTCATACAAGTQAIGEAAEVIRRGDAKMMITGGTEAGLSELGLALFAVGRAYSMRNDEPEKASRPFDADRDGFVGAEGCGILILESLSHALERGAPIYAEVLGYGASNDAYHLIAPDPEAEGAARAMRTALKNAGVNPSHVDYINAHGTGTPLGDVAETMAIKKVLGDHAYEIVINSSKSMIGHLWGAAGAAEAIATIKTIQTGIVHPTINLETPDPDCDLDYVPLKAREVQVNIAMSNSFGLGGQNASIVLARYNGNGAR
ncbi:MAG: beta-ketoacyl-ACP synthase II [Anaerolineae bacterium]